MVIAVLVVMGLIMGSFVNALIWRLHEQAKPKKARDKNLSVLKGRSMCPKCKHPLAAKDLIPVLSWLVLGGKCRYCHKPIAKQYPLVELLTAGLFVFSYLFWPTAWTGFEWFSFALWLAILTGLIALAVYDLKWFILPNQIVYTLLMLVIFRVLVTAIWQRHLGILGGAVWGALILSGLFYVLFQASSGRWIGGGDVRLGLVLGTLVGGPLMSILLLFLASCSGTIYALPMLARGKAKATTSLPFGPYLICAAIITELFGSSIIAWYKGLY